MSTSATVALSPLAGFGKLRELQNITNQVAKLHRPLLAVIAGLLLAAAFPRPGVAGLAWLAPGLLLFLALGQGSKAAFRLGWLAGFAFNLTALYWLLYMPVAVAPIFAWLALSAYCALYPALWVWLCWRLAPASPSHSPTLPLSHFSAALANTAWLQRAVWALACAALWVALEFILGRFLTGFPWLALGVSQYRLLPLVQIVSVTGIAGLSFLVVWFSVSLGCALLSLVQQPQRRWLMWRELLPVTLVLAGVAAFGLGRLGPEAPAARELKVALIQPSIPQTLLWDAKENTNRFNQLLALSRAALASQPDVLIWPEAAVPGRVRYDPFVSDAISGLARAHRVWMIIGADDAEPRQGGDGNDADYFNASFLITPEGKVAARYVKRRLVIFGEYVPLVKWLPFLKQLTPIEGGFTAGEQAVPFELTEPRAKTAVLICFEDAFADLAREAVVADTDFLVNLTNDGWFRESAAQWQHAANSVFRAVENGVPLVRCANNGLTCWIDARGRMHEVYFPDSPDIYRAGFKTARLPLPASDMRRAPTFYNQHGEWFAWGCVVVAVVIVTVNFVRRHA